MNASSGNTPRTINEYLEQLRVALRGADPALIQDALYDAEEHLRAELYERPGRDEAAMLEHVVESYGAPGEVAELYRDQEIKVQRAIRPPRPPKRRSAAGRFFGVAADARTWGALFYMLLALATGIFYFTWAVAGISLSASFSILIIGLPFVVLFFGSVRGLSLLEGRIVETMLGVRMPRRPPYPEHDLSMLKRIGAMFTDPRSWSTLLYMLLMLPLGVAYFSVTITLLSLSLAFIAAPGVMVFDSLGWSDLGPVVEKHVTINWGLGAHVPGWGDALAMLAIGIVLLFATMHLVRCLGHLHGLLAKHLLVRRA